MRHKACSPLKGLLLWLPLPALSFEAGHLPGMYPVCPLLHGATDTPTHHSSNSESVCGDSHSVRPGIRRHRMDLCPPGVSDTAIVVIFYCLQDILLPVIF